MKIPPFKKRLKHLRKTATTMILPLPDFILVGSRAVGNHTPDSDWDYVAAYADKTLPAKLKAMGFTILLDKDDVHRYKDDVHRYRDSNTAEVWENQKQNIQVALVLDVQAKLRITKALEFNPKLAAYDKDLKGTVDRVYLWNAFYVMAGLLVEQ